LLMLVKPFVLISMSLLDKLIFAKNFFFRARLPDTTYSCMYIRKILELAVLKQSTDTSWQIWKVPLDNVKIN
jgi:hypothetical protein